MTPTNVICFSDNRDKVEIAFRDYMNHYFSEVEKREGYNVYDKSISFSDKEKKMDALMKKEIFKISGINFGDGAKVDNAMWASNPVLRWASFAVVNSLIDMIIPDIMVKDTGVYTEIRNGGYGDTFRFDVEPNDLFYISKAGRNQRTVEFQRQYSSTVTVNPENREITVAVNLYKVLCGIESLAKFVTKAALSMESQMNIEIYKAFDTAMSELPTTPEDGKLKIEGWDETEAIRVAQTVTAFNRGAKAVFMGTTLALRNILPKDANYRYMLDSEYVTLGYIRNAFGYDTMIMPQIADWKEPYKTVLDDNKIYIISPGSQKIVKLCLEGASRTNTMNAYQNADLTETTTINKSWGIGISTNAIAGVIELA